MLKSKQDAADGHLGATWLATLPAGRAESRFNEQGQQGNLERAGIAPGKCGKGGTVKP